MQAPKFSRRSFLKSGAVAAAAASLPGFSLPAAAAAALIGTVCQTQHGPVQGIRQEGHLVWYGIPYGASTAGDARWTTLWAASGSKTGCTASRTLFINKESVFSEDF